MPSVRSPGQTLIGAWCDEDFVKKIDRARGGHTRSQFARDALREKLTNMGYRVDSVESGAPSRSGKGGPRKYPAHEPQNIHLNENPAVSKNVIDLTPDPNLSPKVKAAADKIERLAKKRILEKKHETGKH